MERNISTQFLHHPYGLDRPAPDHPHSTQKLSLKQTTFEFRPGCSSQKCLGKSNYFMQNPCPSSTSTIATTKNLNFHLKQRCRTGKAAYMKRISIPTIMQPGEQVQKATAAVEGDSQYSSSENIEIQHEYVKLFQQDLAPNEHRIPQEVTFRTKNKRSSERVHDHSNNASEISHCNKSPHALESKKKVSIQFAPKSPKYTPHSNNGSKLQKTLSTFDFNPKSINLERQVKQLKCEIEALKAEKAKDLQTLQNQRLAYRDLKQSLIQENFLLDQQLQQLKLQLLLKEQQLQNISTVPLQEAIQPVKDQSILERRLENVIACEISKDEKDAILLELRQRLNQKDGRISELERENHHLSTEVERLEFEAKSLESKAVKLNPTNLVSDISVFEEALKYSIEELARYKDRVQAKQDQIDRLKQTYGITKGETERTRNELSIQQLRRITEVQTLKTTFEAERIAKNNQIKDLKHEVDTLQNRVKNLTKQVNEKDAFIFSRIKIHQK